MFIPNSPRVDQVAVSPSQFSDLRLGSQTVEPAPTADP
jgi:hypothetical protein